MSPTDYRRKIKTPQELREIIGAPPRQKKVIMCHGAFDLVHPGHVRHLMYAKEHADILVASITGDAHISKADFRPFVPQDLRAMNLAAFEIVDYVVIDENPTPLENIAVIQPDYFAKGYEYVEGGLHPKTGEELAVLEDYGGEVIFTPGDVVYSSSAFIEFATPNLAAEKLHTLLESEGLGFTELRDALVSLRGARVHVLGDTIVDTYTYCTLIGGGTKTPTLSVRHDREVSYTGGAAVVAKHVAKAGGDVVLTTVLGDDPRKDMVLADLGESGIRCNALVDRTRPTTEKNAFIVDGYRLLKVDRVDNRPISAKLLTQVIETLNITASDAIVFSDFRHGMFTREAIPDLTAAIPSGTLHVADSQVASRWGNILDFQGFDLVTPNEREARFALGDQDSVMRPLAMELYRQLNCKLLILKLGDKGILTYRAPNPDVRSFFTVDSFVDDLVDPVGAGDALLAYATLALARTQSPVIASVLGSFAAAVACEHDGNQPVTPDDVQAKLDAIEKRLSFL